MSPSDPGSGSSGGRTVRLEIKGATELTEIRLTDARFRKVPLQDYVGFAKADLPEGIYEVGFRDGPAWHFETVIARADKKPIKVVQKASGSAAQALTAPDPELPDDPDVEEGTASALTVVLRGASASESPLPDAISHYLGAAELVRIDGTPGPVPELVQKSRSGRLSTSLDTGYWILRVGLDTDDRPLEIPLVACPGWRTRLYLPLHGNAAGEATIDASAMQIRLLRGRSPDDERVRGIESQALYSLAGGRRLQGPELEKLLQSLIDRKFEYPMFGIYGGYLLPCENEREIELLREVVKNLHRLTSGDSTHPDVIALSAKVALRSGESLDRIEPFECPPLLMAGWELMIEAARMRPDLVPPGSLPDRVAGHLWSSSPWVMWSQPEEERPGKAGGPRAAPRLAGGVTAEAAAEPLAFEEQVQLISAALVHRQLREWFRAAGADETARAGRSEIDEVQRLVATQLMPIASDEAAQRARMKAFALDRSSPADRSIDSLSGQLQLPPSTIERATENLARSFLRVAEGLGINLKARAIMARPDVIIPYDPNFLGDGFSVPPPSLSDQLSLSAFADGAVLDYAHYSLVMHEPRRVAAYTACNIDAARAVHVPGGLKWHMDERVGDFQIGPEAYVDNQLDRGHLVRRKDVLWGSVAEAKAANRSTFFYTNAAPQHQNFNQDEWVTLEDWVLEDATEFAYRLCVFTGPVLRSDDPFLDDLPPNLRNVFRMTGRAQIPAAFWKIIVLRDGTAGGDDLAVAAFAMRQSEMWNDKEGRRLLSLKVHQVTVEAIEGWTGLDFGELRLLDALAWSEDLRRLREAGEEPQWPVVTRRADIRIGGAERRARGIRSARTATGSMPSRDARAIRAKGSNCDCKEDNSFDARAAVEALSRDISQLTEMVAREAAQEQPPSSPATRVGPRTRARTAPPSPSQPTSEANESRIEPVVASAPARLKDAMRAFAEVTAAQADVAAGRGQPPVPSELTRIVGGDKVPPGGFPSCCAIGDSTEWFCTGVVIAERAVLTAAHCGASITRIMVGGEQVQPWVTPGARLVSVRRSIVHERYRRHPWNENDINLLILDTPALVPPAKLATGAQLAAATEAQLVGFGYNDPQRPVGFGTKRQVRVPMAPLGDPAAGEDLGQLEDELGFHPAYEFVAGRKGLGRDSCNGDSGGPAYLRAGNDFVVAGLTSRATRAAVVNCGDGGIYVRPDRFLEWINGKLAEAGLPPLPNA